MSAPELRDGDTILVRATIKTFRRTVERDGATTTEDVPIATIVEGVSMPINNLADGWMIEDRKIAVGDRAAIKGTTEVGEVIAVSPPEVVPEQFWLRVPSRWGLVTKQRDQLDRMPVT